MASISAATKAQLFMLRCRSSRTTSNHASRRPVSSSHLAPSNFQRPLRIPETQLNASSTPSPPTPTSHWPSDQTLEQQVSGLRPSTAKYRSSPTRIDARPPPMETSTRVPPGFISFVKYTVLKYPLPTRETTPPPFNLENNPYRARKSWPPDFRHLHPKAQFHFEKTYRRRLLLRTTNARYNWNRYTKLVQHTLVVIMLIYCVFIADPWKKEELGTPLDGFRAWFFGRVAQFEHLPDDTAADARHLAEYYDRLWKKKKAIVSGEEDGPGSRIVAGNVQEAKDGGYLRP